MDSRGLYGAANTNYPEPDETSLMQHTATTNDTDGRIAALVANVERLTTAVERLLENQKPTFNDDSVLTTDELAAAIGVTPRTIARWRLEGRMPKKQAVPGGTVRYRLGDVLAWLERRKPTRRPT